TPFAADGRQLAQTSVSEIIGQLVFKADEVKFVASGREDIDVRMLGSDCPFYLELLSHKQTAVAAKALDDLAKAINQAEQMAGCRADLLALGVVTVDLQWPPSAWMAAIKKRPGPCVVTGSHTHMLPTRCLFVCLNSWPVFYEAKVLLVPQQPPRLKTVTLNNKHPAL
ncbi:hypothetical protein H4R35_002512, partial [Dimargaris xerosporica]